MIIKKKIQSQTEEIVVPEEPQNTENESIDLFDLDNIDFKQRNERRRGDRRRGFRRIDDRNLISRAREEAEAIRESAAKEGYQEGLSQSSADMETFRGSLLEFMNAKQAVFDKIAPELLSICVEIAKKIIKKELTQSPELILESITSVLKGLSKDEAKIMLKVNPSQVSMLKSEVPLIASKFGLEVKIAVVPDESVTEGGCMMVTTNGVVDATIETQIAIVSEALREI